MEIEIKNLTKGYPLGRVDKKIFSTVAKIVLKGENRERESVSLAFVDREEIKKLNKTFRNKDKATDVLSFEIKDQNYLGEVVICPEEAQDLVQVFIHGVLHLCGYDHEKSEAEAEKMEAKEKFYLDKVK